MSDIAIICDGLSKQYRIGERESYKALRDVITDGVAAPFRRLRSALRNGSPTSNGSQALSTQHSALSTEQRNSFWALNGVSFQVKRGEVVGIIGRNGAGKSTLLKILSRITKPTKGHAEIHGRVGSLLEVGTGFHPELTGRENIYLNAAILGMRKAEVEEKFDEIVAFAEVEQFIDTPVKRYSSGMYVRLAFAVAAHMDTEILLVDEVLAVGDAQFQKKCLGKMGEVAKRGRTVVFVSHNMAAVQRLCSKGLLLEGGNLINAGTINEVVARYNSVGEFDEVACFDPSRRSGSGWAQISDVRLVDQQNRSVSSRPSDSDLVFELHLNSNNTKSSGASLRGLVVELVINSDQGQPLMSLMNVDDEGGIGLPETKDCFVRVKLSGPTFVPGRYHLNVFLGIPYLQHIDEIPDAFVFDITPPVEPWRPYELHEIRGHTCRKAEWECIDTTKEKASIHGGSEFQIVLRG